jgi:glutamyl-tRNA synthetase/glutamyl-Q tRNA(Asp) synthetase
VRLDEAAYDSNIPMRTRFAPSPTGYLHLGHVAHALYVWKVAGEFGAEVIFRMEDHDRGRCRPEFEAAIIEDIAWLGFACHGAMTRQSEREAIYQDLALKLQTAGLLYGCACSRKEVLARTGDSATGEELRYDNHCRDLGLPLEFHTGWRVRLPDTEVAFEDLRLGVMRQRPRTQCGDLLIRDRHGNWTYQFCVVVDDWLQGVNLVVRGEDLLSSTGRQILLGELLGREKPPHYFHHPLIHDAETGKKLSKRDLAHAVRELRHAGVTRETVLREAARLSGFGADFDMGSHRCNP